MLAYYGISLEDEHRWDPALYLSPASLRARCELLARHRCAVLSLDRAMELLAADALPPRAVVLTFDDGSYDFLVRALPILTEFGFPSTVYVTTHYAVHPRPVFDVVVRYLLWRGHAVAPRTLARVLRDVLVPFRGPELAAECAEHIAPTPRRRPVIVCLDADGRPEMTASQGDTPMQCRPARERAASAIIAAAAHAQLSSAEKDDVARAVASAVGVDYDALTASRRLQIMRPSEVAACARAGVDISLHTHRHRLPADFDAFSREVVENRAHLLEMGAASSTLRHFCYPSGVHHPVLYRWLRRLGVATAVTCDPGLSAATTNTMAVPRLVDADMFSPTQFMGWVSGVAALLPRRVSPRYPQYDRLGTEAEHGAEETLSQRGRRTVPVATRAARPGPVLRRLAALAGGLTSTVRSLPQP